MTDKQQEHKLWVLRTKEEELKQRAESAEAEVARLRQALGALVGANDTLLDDYLVMYSHRDSDGMELGLYSWEFNSDVTDDDIGDAMDTLQVLLRKAKAALSKAPQEEAKQDE